MNSPIGVLAHLQLGRAYAMQGDNAKAKASQRTAGIEVKDPESYPNIGRFARLHDPEKNPIELWQPA